MNGLASRWLLSALTIIAWLPAASAQRYGQNVPFEQDTHAFRYILEHAGLKPITRFDEATADPRRTAIIVFGMTQVLDGVPAGVKSFVDRGGALMIATDRGLMDERRREWTSQAWETAFHVGISPSQVMGGNKSSYRGSSECPLVRFLDVPSMPQGPAMLPVATNISRFLILDRKLGCTLTTFAEFPSDCKAPKSILDPSELEHMALAAGQVYPSGGKILVMADHSIFINGMMLQRDNGNYDFANNCVNWLVAGDPAKAIPPRDQALLMVDGVTFRSFHVPLSAEPEPQISSVDLANRLVAEIEDRDLINQMLLKHTSINRILATLIAVMTILLMMYGFYRLSKAAYHREPQIPSVRGRVRQLSPALALIDLRHQALVRENNLWEMARDAAWASLLEAGIEPQAWAKPPKIQVTGSEWRRLRWRAKIRRMWHLASSSVPSRVSRRQFARLVNQMDEMKAALADGTLRITARQETA